MTENIKIESETNTVYLSGSLIENLKKFLKCDEVLRGKLKEAQSGIKYTEFRDIVDQVVTTCKKAVETCYRNSDYCGYSDEWKNEVKESYDRYEAICPSQEKNLLEMYLQNNNLESFEELINLCSEMQTTWEIVDLIRAKDDHIIDAKYFMEPDEVEQFERQFGQAIQSRDTKKMKNLIIEKLQNPIKDEWKKYVSNLEDITDDNFRLIVHMTDRYTYNPDEEERKHLSCTLITQDFCEMFGGRNVGYILDPNGIEAVDSRNIFTNNYGEEVIRTRDLENYFQIYPLHHPQRIIAECKEEQKNSGEAYNEISKSLENGFHPIAIFCATNGLKMLDSSYRNAIELQKSLPDLEIITIDSLKVSKGEVLDKKKLEVLGEIKNKEFGKVELPLYESFFEKLSKLKEKEDYTEEEIVELCVPTNPNDIPNYAEYVTSVVLQNCRELRYVPENIPNYEEIIIKAVSKFEYALEYVPADKITHNIALAAVSNSGNALRYVPADEITQDVAIAAVSNSTYALQYVPADKITQDVAVAAVTKDGSALRYVPQSVQGYEEIATSAVDNDIRLLSCVSKEMPNYIEFISRYQNQVLESVSQNKMSLRDVPSELSNYEQIVLSAINSMEKNSGGVLAYVPNDKINYDIAAAALANSKYDIGQLPNNRELISKLIDGGYITEEDIEYSYGELRDTILQEFELKRNNTVKQIVSKESPNQEEQQIVEETIAYALKNLTDREKENINDQSRRNSSVRR